MQDAAKVRNEPRVTDAAELINVRSGESLKMVLEILTRTGHWLGFLLLHCVL